MVAIYNSFLLLQLFLVCFCSALSATIDSSSNSLLRHRVEKQVEATKLFEGDLMPVYDQILDTYGPDVVAELVAKGIFDKEDEKGAIECLGDNCHPNLWSNRINDVVLVPYEFSESFVGDKNVVEQTMRELEMSSGVVGFIPTKNETLPYLYLTSDEVYREEEFLKDDPECWSFVGQQKHRQHLNLGKGCIVSGFIKHLLLHALGFWHTSSRFDRDEYVTILWDNVFPGLEYDFEKRRLDDTLGQPYDFASIMHYGNMDYSNGTASMTAPEPIGQLDHLSEGDIRQLRLLYQCQSGPRNLEDYVANPCTADCKCWEMAPGSCSGNDFTCQGSLVCRRDKCVNPKSFRARKIPVFLAATIVVLGCLVLLGVSRGLGRRQGYQPV